MKFTILIGRKYLFSYIAQSNCIIEILNRSFLKKKNIETKEVCKFLKITK